MRLEVYGTGEGEEEGVVDDDEYDYSCCIDQVLT